MSKENNLVDYALRAYPPCVLRAFQIEGNNMPHNHNHLSSGERQLLDTLIWIMTEDTSRQAPENALYIQEAIKAKNALRGLHHNINTPIFQKVTPNKTQKAQLLLNNIAQLLKNMQDENCEQPVFELYLAVLSAVTTCLDSMKFFGKHCENPVTRVLSFNKNPDKKPGLTINALHIQISLLTLGGFRPSSSHEIGASVSNIKKQITIAMGPEGHLINYLETTIDRSLFQDSLVQNLRILRNLRVLNPNAYFQELDLKNEGSLIQQIKADFMTILDGIKKTDFEHEVKALIAKIVPNDNFFQLRKNEHEMMEIKH